MFLEEPSFENQAKKFLLENIQVFWYCKLSLQLDKRQSQQDALKLLSTIQTIDLILLIFLLLDLLRKTT